MNVKLLFLWKCFLTFLLSISSIDSFFSFFLPVPIKYKGDPFLLEPEMVVAKEGEKYDTVLLLLLLLRGKEKAFNLFQWEKFKATFSLPFHRSKLGWRKERRSEKIDLSCRKLNFFPSQSQILLWPKGVSQGNIIFFFPFYFEGV